MESEHRRTLTALQACVDVTLHNGVPVDPKHPARLALTEAEIVIRNPPRLRRPIETWRKCDPNAMAKMSEAAIMFAFNDLLHDVLELSR